MGVIGGVVRYIADGSSVSPVVTFGLPILAVFLSPLTSWLTLRVVKRRELAEQRRSDVIREHELGAVREEQERKERVRRETLRWAGPILNTVDDLRHRLRNILENAGYLALDPEWQPPQDWSMTHEYFLNSTMYLFAAYFSYTELLRSSLSLEFFRSQKDKDELFGALRNVGAILTAYPAHWSHGEKDRQVFRLQQRAIGESTALPNADAPRCLSYPEFTARLADPAYAAHMQPLRALLLKAAPDSDGRWTRLQHVRQALDDLAAACQRLLSIA